MGVYDTFGKLGLQIKAGPCAMEDYKTGDKVPLPDGVYVANEGVMVVQNGIFIMETERFFDKWGGILDPYKVINYVNSTDSDIDEMTKVIVKENAIKLAEHHKRTCEGEECGISLHLLYVMLNGLGIELTEEERTKLF
jgi:hypothetical protein